MSKKKDKEIGLNDLLTGDKQEVIVDNEKEIDEVVPNISSPEWHDYVMSKFLPHELDKNNRPYVFGLRRVINLIFGKVIKSNKDVIQYATNECYRATVKHEVTVIRHNIPEDEFAVQTFSEVADCAHDNCEKYWNFPVATASTRAESKNYRVMLNLRCISSEEAESSGVTTVLEESQNVPQTINTPQLNAINKVCKILNINAIEYLKDLCKQEGCEFNNIPLKVGSSAVGKLNGLMANIDDNMSNLPKNIVKGYNSEWRKEIKN
jgi:hypothetical protein